MAEALHQAGYSVSAPLLPGHGTQPEDMNRISWRDWISAVTESYLELKGYCRQVAVLGESMGGVLSLYLASQFPEITALVLYAPALRIPALWKANLARFFIATTPKSYINEGQSTEIYPWQGYNVVPVGGAAQLVVLQRKVQQLLFRIHQPTLIFQGAKDHTIDPQSAKMVYEQISVPIKHLVRLELSGHCILLDSQFETVKAQTLQFLEQSFSSTID